jgi:hypothetical protein
MIVIVIVLVVLVIASIVWARIGAARSTDQPTEALLSQPPRAVRPSAHHQVGQSPRRHFAAMTPRATRTARITSFLVRDFTALPPGTRWAVCPVGAFAEL